MEGRWHWLPAQVRDPSTPLRGACPERSRRAQDDIGHGRVRADDDKRCQFSGGTSALLIVPIEMTAPLVIPSASRGISPEIVTDYGCWPWWPV